MPLPSDVWAIHLGDSPLTAELRSVHQRYSHLPLRHPPRDPSELAQPSSSDNRSDAAGDEPQLFESVVSSWLPMSTYHEVDQAGECCACSVCLQPYSEDDTVKRLPCLHVFHARCIDRWLAHSPSCPYCRLDIASLVPSARLPEHSVGAAEPAHAAAPTVSWAPDSQDAPAALEVPRLGSGASSTGAGAGAGTGSRRMCSTYLGSWRQGRARPGDESPGPTSARIVQPVGADVLL